jgi:type II secretory pathway predicted ATPase ExeA
MNERHFGLHHRPFPATPDLACYYPATSHEAALESLRAGLADEEGMLLLIGSPGTGKTLLCRRLLEQWGEEVESICLTHSHLGSRTGLYQAILFDLSLPHAGRSEQEMRLDFIDHLLNRYAAGKRTVLVIDEAHHLGVDLLEEVRLLGNLEGSHGKALQVLLVGQPALLATLTDPALESLRQRLVVRTLLEPLGVDEAADYLLHHLRIAGGVPERILSTEALELLARNTGGIPRLLNQTAHQALRLAAMNDAAEVDAEAALEALHLLELPCPLAVDSREGHDFSANPSRNPVDSSGQQENEEAEADIQCRLFVAPGRSA